jgi:lipopolysaccharide export LptBFGC system permease protein LptF
MYLVIIEIVCFLAFMILPFVGPRGKKKKTTVRKSKLSGNSSYTVNRKGYLERAAVNH